MEHDEKLAITSRMINYGGSFARALAKAMLQADHINLKKIEDAFPELIERYRTW